ncbi:sensor histidine kinase [Mangrovimonas xylaniphaga]|uniref:sensor histidine kinase n=1 Tax=Mangrovimonas xylaniphaga TaxID=1645915 RepID=UPI0006B58216|nr:HAMP domain-containing sensor histidine kinase [Mangrovimonas xylaniphaga]
MKIRNKIALIFMGLAGALQLLAFVLVYFLAKNYFEDSFSDRLAKRASIAAKAYADKDELNTPIYEDIRNKHLQKLPEEKEYIFSVDQGDMAGLDELPPQVLENLRKGEVYETKIENVFYVGSIQEDNQGDFNLVLSAVDIYGNMGLNNLRNILILIYLFSSVLLYFLGKYFASRLLSPLSKIVKKTNSIRASNLFERLTVNNNKDELNELSKTINDMLDRLETSFEVQSNFINNASHELKSPLTAILTQTEIALIKERNPEEYQDTLKGIEQEAQRLDLLINSLLKFAQTNQGSEGLIQEVRLDELVMEVIQSMDLIRPEHQIQLDLNSVPEDPDSLVVQGNYGLLKIALNNVLDNACKFSDNKKVVVKITSNENSSIITVTDQGVGIPSKDIKNIYQPFFRASNARNVKGYGFGLPFTNKILKLHGGNIEVYSEEGKGTIFSLIIPRASLS